ncbi:MAG: 30S ribosomal protein S1 [Bacteroidia bacterium]|nr:30S ribosomal protein S1 [Bacteroidia bacterium]
MLDNENEINKDELLEPALLAVEEQDDDTTDDVVEAPVQDERDDFDADLIDLNEIAGFTNDDDDDEDWWKGDGTYSASQRDEMTRVYASTLKQFNANEIVSGTIVAVGEKDVVINIGFKSEGVVPASEFRDMTPQPGMEVEVFIETVEDTGGHLLLSRKRAKHLRAWEMINDSMDKDLILNGVIMRRTKGGFVIDIQGIEAFLPGSQIDVKPVRDFDAYVGRTMEFKVVKINHAYENVVVSHKILIEAKLEEQRREILQNLEKGQVLEGTVKNMTSFGVFIDLGGVDGLLHITDISWGRINHPEEVLVLDQKVNVVVLDFDEAKKRISLGMKQLTAHPWDSLPEAVTEGARIRGKVVTIADYGVFVEVTPGVEGLIHTSEMSWSQHSKNPGELFSTGEEIEAVILNVDRNERKMSLGLKQLQLDPWSVVEERFPVNSRHTGLVRNMTSYGLFIELAEGIDGLVHISDLSWTKKFAHPSEYVKVGENLEVIVLEIDKENRRLSLGHKQLTEDVWETFAAIFTLGSTHTGTIKRIDAKGATVELEYGVEGTVNLKHLKAEDGKEELKQEDTSEFVVIEFNKDAKRLVLSHVKTWQKAPEKKAVVEEPKDKSRSGKPAAAPAAKAGTTTLGDLDVLAKLKVQMEAQEKKTQKDSKKSAEVTEEAEDAAE